MKLPKSRILAFSFFGATVLVALIARVGFPPPSAELDQLPTLRTESVNGVGKLDSDSSHVKTARESSNNDSVDVSKSDGGVSTENWLKIRDGFNLSSVNTATGLLEGAVVEFLDITDDERLQVDAGLSTAMETIKSLESAKARLVADESGEAIVVDAIDLGNVRNDLLGALELALGDRRASILMDLVTKSDAFNYFGRYPVSIYFEEGDDGAFKFNITSSVPAPVVHERSNNSDDPLAFRPPETIQVRTKVSQASSHFDRYAHLLNSVSHHE